MTLSEYFKKEKFQGTDKNTTHDYINGYYCDEFTPIKNKNLKILEIGIWEGGSLQVWDSWFTNTEIQAVEINKRKWIYKPEHIKVTNKSGYSEDTLNLFEDNYFDYIIDDGPHNVESQIFAIKNWLSKIKIGGKLVIEDVQGSSSLKKLEEVCINNKLNYKIVDLRKNKGRFDDLIIEITKK